MLFPGMRSAETADEILQLRWGRDRPLPQRLLKLRKPAGPLDPFEVPPWWQTGPVEQPFDFCGHVRRLLEDMVRRCEAFARIDVRRILVGMIPARNGRSHGLQARVTPLRFQHGELTRQRSGVVYQVQRLFVDNHEYLYLMSFCLPRFLDQDFDDKFVTLFHELYHLSPEGNGDLRRHNGRYRLHTHSQRCYDKVMAQMARAYLAGNPEPRLHDFLRLDFSQLCRRHGGVLGVVVPRPKIVPLYRMSAPANREKLA